MNLRYLIILVLCSFFGAAQHQHHDTTAFDEAACNRIADQKGLRPEERAEFLNFKRRMHYLNSLTPATSPAPPTFTIPSPSGRRLNPASTHAGPCTNIDFEAGSAAGWTLTNGFHPNSTSVPACCPTAGGTGAITSGAGVDPYGGFPVVFPGGNFSYVLGNNGTGARADRLTQTFFVTPSNANFTYRYAVVLQDPGHNLSEQPAFVIRMMDSLGMPIPCTAYSVAAGNNIPGFLNSSTAGVIYKPWTNVALDLSPVIGQNVTIEFTTYDCSLGGHFGYAYVDGLCTNFATSVSDTACAGVPIAMCGPVGFATYSWSGPGVPNNYANICLNTAAAGVYSCETILVPGCPGPTFTHTLYVRPDPTLTIIPPTPTLCFGTPSTVLTASVNGGTPPYTYTWSTTSNNSTVSVGPGSYTVQLNDKSVCPAKVATSVVSQFTAPITAVAGADQVRCKSSPVASLNGAVVIATGALWSGGSGTFSQPLNSLANTYSPSATEISTGSVQLLLTTTGNSGCAAHTDTVVINYQNLPVPLAGSDQSICVNNPVTTFTGAISGFTSTPVWSTTGSGNFSGNTSLVTTYSPGATDITTGSVSIVLATNNNGVCPVVRDTVKIIFTPAPVVTAGNNFTICSVNSASLTNSIQLTGNVSGPTTTGAWLSSGDGAFSPSSTTMSPVYTPGSGDLAAGTVSIILVSANNQNCLAVRDTMLLTIRPQVAVNAGINTAICSTSGTVALTSSLTGNGAVTAWTGGSGSFSNNNNTNTTYSISTADRIAGNVIFTITASGNTPCPAIYDTVMVKIDTVAQSNAGGNFRVCAGNTISLTGNVSSAAGTGSWSTSGSGFFGQGSQQLNTTYIPSAGDINSGFVTFSLTSTGNGMCAPNTDTLRLRILRTPTLNVIAPSNVCMTSPVAALSATITGGMSSLQWSHNGQGTLSPNPASGSVTYTVQTADKMAGQVIFTVSSTGSAPCAETQSILPVKIDTLAKSDAGSNFRICAGSNIPLSGNVQSAAGTGSWSTSGTGSFPQGNQATANYQPSASDISFGLVTFTLNSTGNGTCASITDTVRIRIIRQPTLTASVPSQVCSTSSLIALSSTLSGGVGNMSWSHSGTGSVLPSSSNHVASYVLQPQDVIAGQVTFTASTNSNAPCAETQSVLTVPIGSLANVQAGANQFICSAGGTIGLTGNIVGVTNTGTWSTSGTGLFANNVNSTTAVYMITPADIAAGAVSFTLNSTNNGACPQTRDSVLVGIEKAALINPGPDRVICSDQQTVGINAGLLGPVTVSWSTTGSGSLTSNTGVVNTYALSDADYTAGRFNVMLTTAAQKICPQLFDTIQVSIYKRPLVALDFEAAVCERLNPVALTSSVTFGNGAIEWKTAGSGTFVPSAFVPNASYLFSANDVRTGTVNIILTSPNNDPCLNIAASRTLTIYPGARARFTPSTYTLNLPAPPVRFANQSINASSYAWNFGDGLVSKAFEPEHPYLRSGYYEVTLVANNEQNCSDTTRQTITVIADVQFPNAFTPRLSGQGDGTYTADDYSNDVFFPFTSGATEYKLTIFNRWGELLFTSTDLNIGWDGYFNGKLCQQDTYVYQVEITFFDGRKFNKTGTVMLLR